MNRGKHFKENGKTGKTFDNLGLIIETFSEILEILVKFLLKMFKIGRALGQLYESWVVLFNFEYRC